MSLKDKIVKILLREYEAKQSDINDALALAKKKRISFGRALIARNIVTEEVVQEILVSELGIPFISISKFKIDPELKHAIPERIARQHGLVPLTNLEHTMTVAISDPLNVVALDDLKSLVGKDIEVVMSTPSEIDKALDNFYGSESDATISEFSREMESGGFEIVMDEEQEADMDVMADESGKAPIIRMVNLIVKEALKQKASDIHIEPTEGNMRVRYRVDGVLQDILEIPKDSQGAVTVRIKIMSRLDITVNYMPQDGRFKLKFGEKEVDFRVSLLPTTFGQKIVMRILDKANLSVGLDGLGISERSYKLINEAIRKPFGMFLVTGPTGSGKSTTLYSAISLLNTPERNIITVEDPVEYQVEGLTQIQARSEIGLTFAEGLRAMLRQSPDVVMVGEIRDNETADIAIKASLTGQLVLSTLHTNDAAGALTRLVDMDVEPFLVASSIVLVSAQRLCRKICTVCKEEIKITDHIREQVEFSFKPGDKLHQGKGCDACRKTGYSGRTCVTEVLDIDDTVRTLLLEGRSSDAIKEYARQEKGMLTLWEDAVQKCLQGVTTLEEALRVTSE